MAWQEFIEAPVKHVMELTALFRTCKVVGCNCPCWHGSSGPGEPQALLDLWGRSFLRPNFKHETPAEASLFSVFLRVPLALLEPLLGTSGTAGLYLEPRDSKEKKTADDYKVVWLAKSQRAETLLLKQSHSQVIGLARHGDRFGLRCKATDEEALHKALKPTEPFLSQGSTKTWHAGPWPFGTQRQAVSKLLGTLPWIARPCQPVQGGGASGMWWRVIATSPPTSGGSHSSRRDFVC